MKLLMLPHYKELGLNNGVGQVIYNYHQWFPKVSIEVTTNPNDSFDLSASHLGHYPQADIFFSHGFWWGDDISNNQRQQNTLLTQCAINAKAVIVPSEYVATTFRREFRINPYIVGHGVNLEEWQHNYKNAGYILWNKNRNTAVCNPQAVYALATKYDKVNFVTTFVPLDKQPIPNIRVTGKLPFDEMKPLIQQASIYLATAHETFGIGVLEALASGVPILAFDWGGTAGIVEHKVNGYLVEPNDYNALAGGLEWLLTNRDKLVDNCKSTAQQYNWLSVVEKLKGAFENVLSQ